jgi:branched-chain amino acid transport system permease protein
MMAEAMGVNTLRYKIGIFLIAALFASLSGWLLAHFQRTVNPSPFGLKMGIEYLFMAVLGGVGHIWGAISGALITKLLEDQLQVLLPRLIGTSGSYEVIVFGVRAGAGAQVPARRHVVAGRALAACNRGA